MKSEDILTTVTHLPLFDWLMDQKPVEVKGELALVITPDDEPFVIEHDSNTIFREGSEAFDEMLNCFDFYSKS